MAELSKTLQAAIRRTSATITTATVLQDRIERIGRGFMAIDNTGQPRRVAYTTFIGNEPTLGREATVERAMLADVERQLTENAQLRIAAGEPPADVLATLDRTHRELDLLLPGFRHTALATMRRQLAAGNTMMLTEEERRLPEFNFSNVPLAPPISKELQQLLDRYGTRDRRGDLGPLNGILPARHEPVGPREGEPPAEIHAGVRHPAPTLSA